jgi:hypothetical protein
MPPMQREENGLIVISCGFCRRDWDGIEPMIEGHRGSVICPDCLGKAAVEVRAAAAGAGAETFQCTLCLRANIPLTMEHWSNPAHPEAIVCMDCIQQATGAMGRTKRTSAG